MLSYISLSDVELFTLTQKDDHRAYSEIYNRYSRLLYSHAYKKLGDRELSMDFVQDLFTNFWIKRAELNIKSSLAAYLFTAVRNRILDHFAFSNMSSGYIVHIQQSSPLSADLTDHRIREKQLMALIEIEVAALPDKMRKIFEMSRKEHMSHKEIAQELGISEQTVRKQIQNSIRILRPKLRILITVLFLFEK